MLQLHIVMSGVLCLVTSLNVLRDIVESLMTRVVCDDQIEKYVMMYCKLQ